MRRPCFKTIAAVRNECFHNVFKFMSRNRKWSAVHGVPMGQGAIEGVRFGHAWAEIDHDGLRWVYDPSSDLLMPAGLYYSVGRIEDAVVYPAKEFFAKAVRTGHSGPWDKITEAAATHGDLVGPISFRKLGGE